MRNVGCVKIADGDLGDGGVKEKLVWRKANIVWLLRGIDNTVGTLFERCFKLLLVSLGIR